MAHEEAIHSGSNLPHNEAAPQNPPKAETSHLSTVGLSADPAFAMKPPVDTLVFIDCPNTQPFREPSHLKVPLRLHSESLLSAGSQVFRELLSPTKQFRIVRRRKLVNRLPEGIKFVIDLTPPDEGDEAVDLIANLSLSLVVSQWHTMDQKLFIGKKFIGGSDESSPGDLIPLLGTYTGFSSSTEVHEPAHVSPQACFFPQRYQMPQLETTREAQGDLETAAMVSSRNGDEAVQSINELRFAECSPIRHRMGVLRLLSVIEAERYPNLDSAAKAWTLWVLAKYFECTSLVVDCISTWVLPSLNCLFGEILPEMTARMGLSISSHALIRPAFCVLVGEETLALKRRHRSHLQPNRLYSTLLGHRREDVDEDLQNRIEYASKAFEERISRTFDKLFSRQLEWLDDLPEYKKILRFREAIETEGHDKYRWNLTCTETLRYQILCCVRRRIIYALSTSIEDTSVGGVFSCHRRMEDLGLPESNVSKSHLVYDGLDMQERVFIRAFWMILWRIGLKRNDLLYVRNNKLPGWAEGFVQNENLDSVSYSDLSKAALTASVAVHGAIQFGFFNDGIISDVPEEDDCSLSYTESAIPDPKGKSHAGIVTKWWAETVKKIVLLTSVHWWDEHHMGEHRTPTSSQAVENSGSISTSTVYQGASVPRDYQNVAKNSPCLNLDELLEEIHLHIQGVVDTMLNSDPMVFYPSVTDVLVCLTDTEFKYLPIFAGGEDDGTGLAFADPIPEAVSGSVGPSPKFSTGSSVANSEKCSELFYGGGHGESDGDSQMVDNRFSGVFPRARVMVGSGVASLACSDAGDIEISNRVVESMAAEMGPIFTPGTSIAESVTEDTLSEDTIRG